ncbi:MAG TPA: hypothetical protein VND22_07810, partial [Actinomycetota bacterium]|nr:hypothetical protein [Actinomycetota bacterium]
MMATEADSKRKVLELVAEGKVSPDEAINLIKALEDGPKTQNVSTDTGPADGVRVVGSFRAVRIEGDSSVVSAIAEGPFRLRRDGGMMVFEE